ncbi:MAG: ABC transporter ATP-binding protein/permease [Bacteroides sp.]|nr:ABC transporter ATP-binding protein/permease [Bacteroides sp.]MCM1413257.1 ABC transporter ATP-binding protein/permease [Bacteroides sp.]MCM1471433.1 ABC transporter ATP-binding protein/permease [Bacteroides sp.]
MKASTSLTWLRYAGRLYDMTAGMRLRIALRIVAGVLRVGAMLLFVFISKQLVDVATDRGASMPLLPLVLAMVVCTVGQIALGAWVSRLATVTGALATNRLRSRIFDRSMRALYGRGLHTSDIMERMKKDVDALAELISASVPSAIVTLVQLVAAFFFLAALDWRLALIMLAIMPIALITGKVLIRRMRRLSQLIRQAESASHSLAQEHLRQRMTDAAFEAVPTVVSRFDRLQLRVLRLIMRRNNYSLFSRTMIHLGFSAGYLTAFFFGVYGLQSGAITFGVMTAFLQLVGQVQRPALELSNYVPGFIYGLTSAERVADLTDADTESESEERIDAVAPIGVAITGMHYRYPDGDDNVVTDMSAVFPAGQLTAITGLTGAGKTTLLRLIMGFLKPVEGSVEFVDAHGRRFAASPTTRRLIALVPQGNSLFSGTIRSNLEPGNREASDEEIRRALTLACAEFVYDLPDGLYTRVGESGARLSEGQAQRIAIARALLRTDAPVMLLDEPTSALDPATERRLLHNLSQLGADRTILMITHRTAAIDGIARVEL